MRYVLEGEWTGYTSAQRCVVHREVISEKRAKRIASLHKIIFSDNTALILYVRKATYREKVTPRNGYTSLIQDAEQVGKSIVHVDDLRKAVSK